MLKIQLAGPNALSRVFQIISFDRHDSYVFTVYNPVCIYADYLAA